jgi:hypothetical protein
MSTMNASLQAPAWVIYLFIYLFIYLLFLFFSAGGGEVHAMGEEYMVTPAGLEAHARDGHFAYGMQVRPAPQD